MVSRKVVKKGNREGTVVARYFRQMVDSSYGMRCLKKRISPLILNGI